MTACGGGIGRAWASNAGYQKFISESIQTNDLNITRCSTLLGEGHDWLVGSMQE